MANDVLASVEANEVANVAPVLADAVVSVVGCVVANVVALVVPAVVGLVVTAVVDFVVTTRAGQQLHTHVFLQLLRTIL